MKYHFFYGGICSQWHLCDFTSAHNIKFNCAEQYMMFQKAMLFFDHASADEIMDAVHPAEQKRLGRNVKNFDPLVWEGFARDVVYKGNYMKFSQNPDLLEDLLAIDCDRFVEASPYDKIWGIGMDRYHPDRFDPMKWKGKNMLGDIITEVRNYLR